MSKQRESSTEERFSRRKLIRLAGAAVVATGAGSLLPPQAEAVVPQGEQEKIYELLALWLVVSTNKKFLPFDKTKINSDTDIDIGIAGDGIKKANKFAADLEAARATFQHFAEIYKYKPGECPKYLTTLKAIKKLGD
jgi:hypothetical protein